MLSFIQHILEELNPSQKQIVRGWVGETQGKSPAKEITGHLPFDKNGRMVIPLEKADSTKSKVSPDVEEHIRKKGFSPVDSTYAEKEEEHTIPTGERKGEVIKRKKRQTIGSLLSDNPELQKKHAAQGAKAGAQSKNLSVVISRNPEDVAGMSTGRGWTSCKRMSDPEAKTSEKAKGGPAEKFLKNDITTTGTHVAYLVNSDDKEAKNPIARISLNPYVSASGQHTILRPPRDSANPGRIQQYGGGNEDFEHTVRNWAETNTPQDPKEPFYKIHDSTYDDEHLNDPNTRSHYFSPSIDKKTIGDVIKKTSPETVKALLKSHPDIDESHVKAAYNRPDIQSKMAALAHPLIPKKHIDEALNSADTRLHEAAMRNPNATNEHIKFGLGSSNNNVKKIAARHKKASEEDLHAALQDPTTDEDTRTLLKSRIKQKEHIKKLLAMRNR